MVALSGIRKGVAYMSVYVLKDPPVAQDQNCRTEQFLSLCTGISLSILTANSSFCLPFCYDKFVLRYHFAQLHNTTCRKSKQAQVTNLMRRGIEL